ncbi:NAD(P)H-dependent oxidoreductase [Epibacterium ulvae]|uniref:Modulator of drug activity B n=1 Tax=Epibacterium ulvae TaxID=1156985 RepID=A0A1G5R9J1_9RHOB|nr:NAD(P)H-dependent oxidoreductase [Epibacterium ulvae]SCZ70772.1 modulator of drug activity B [Epibacterium ulvae]
MSNVFILNGHQPSDFTKGELNKSLVERAERLLSAEGHQVRHTAIASGYDVNAEADNYVWADVVVLQFPVNWMGVPWSFKKYMDEVYTVGGYDGRLSNGDGRTAEKPKENYGLGGTRADTKYMLSATLNAPRDAFDNPQDGFFKGLSLDELLAPVHYTMKFFGMTALPTFAAHDVAKNPEVESDFARFDAHLKAHF